MTILSGLREILRAVMSRRLLIASAAAAALRVVGVPATSARLQADPLSTPPPVPADYCWNASGEPQGPAQAPTPFMYLPVRFAEVPGSARPEDSFGWIWSSQMDHGLPTYARDGKIETLGEELSWQYHGTKVYPGGSVFESDVAPERTGSTILAYESPALESFMFYDGHDGHDFAVGEDALAAADGTVSFAEINQSALGRVVELVHPEGYLTRYAHLAAFADEIEVGREVQAGDPIGTIGGSAWIGGRLHDGYWGTHLHFGVFRWNEEQGAWQVTDPFGWDLWKSPSEQGSDPLQRCNGEVSHNLWMGWWPRNVDAVETSSEQGEDVGSLPLHDRYVGGSLADEGGSEPYAVDDSADDGVPMLQGNPAHTGVMPGPAPKGDPVELWRVSTEGRVFSSPAVVDGTVYIGGGDAGGGRKFYALDAQTGQERWHFTTERPVRGSPAVSNGIVVFSADQNVYAKDAQTGEERWRFSLESGSEGGHFASPVIGNKVIYVGGSIISNEEIKDSKMYALDLNSGTERWHFGVDNYIVSTPAFDDGLLYFGSGGRDIGSGNLYALDAETGTERWRVPVDSGVDHAPTVVGGVVFFGGGGDSIVHAVDAETGTERWRFATEIFIGCSPAVVNGVVYVGTGDVLNAGEFYALDAETGAELWRFAPNSGGINSSPAVVDGVVFFGGTDNQVYALDAQTGEERWRFDAGGAVRSSPAVINGMVIVGVGTADRSDGPGAVIAIGGTGGQFGVLTEGTMAVLTDAAVLRGAPNVQSVAVADVSGGAQVTLGQFEDASGGHWWRVTVDGEGVQGWLPEEILQPAG